MAEETAEAHAFGLDASLGALAGLLSDAGLAIAALDRSGKLLMLSPAFEHILQRDFAPLGAEDLATAFHLYDRDGSRALDPGEVPIVRAFRGEQVRDEVVTVRIPGQPVRYLRTSAAPMVSVYGDRIGAWAVSTDVTAIVSTARGEHRSMVTETVNHHLRTPLTTILGHAELLAEREDLPAGARSSIDSIARAARRLEAVTDWVSELLESKR
jgi:signal transduction histidine kinase